MEIYIKEKKEEFELEIQQMKKRIAGKECFNRNYVELFELVDGFQLYNFLIKFDYSDYEWLYMQELLVKFWKMLNKYRDFLDKNGFQHNFVELYTGE